MSGYIGPAPVPQATQTRQAFTATSGQTTFNTAGYTPGYVDVYLNGVKLAAADYTATNGSDIVLAAGAAASDILEVVAFEIFQVADQDFTGDFSVDTDTLYVDSTNDRVGIGTSSPTHQLTISGTSTGFVNGGGAFSIGSTSNHDVAFYTNNQYRMRIDTSGNLLVGKTSANSDNAGFEANSTGFTAATRSNGTVFVMDRLTSDGEIVSFRKDNTTVGSIGVSGSSIIVGEGTTGLKLNGSSAKIIPRGTDNSTQNGTIDLGDTSNKFKDLYLSGSAQLANITNGAGEKIILNSDNMVFQVQASERMRIDSSGNVGIGTSNPTQPLHINATNPSNGIVTKFVSNGNPWVQWAGPSTSWQLGATSNGLEIYNDNNSTTKATLNIYGDLGLGTQTPNAYGGNWRTITLNGVSGGELDFEVNGSLKGDIFAGAQDFYIRHHDSNATMRFRVGGSSINEERMTIAANGTVGIQSRVTVGTLNSKTGLSRMRVGRSLINFFNYGQNSTGNNYLHIKTNLYMGSASNTQPTMSLVHIKGYTYGGESIDSMFGFHNWSGSFYSPVYTNNGSRTVVSSSYNSYQSTDGYAVLVLNIGTSYPGITIDWHQAYEYTFQDVQVSAYQRSSSSTGVY